MASRTARRGTDLAQRLKVLLIAPRTYLENADAETQRIVNALHPECLLGTVTTSDVLDAVQAQQFAIIWFLGHSNSEGLQLSDGILSPAHLTQILRQSPPCLVVLNSCSSLHTAILVHDDLQCAVVCTVLDVPDLDAYITGASLANALAQGLDIAQAYQVSRPATNRQYILLNGSVKLNGANELDDMHRLILRTSADLQRGLADLRRELEAVRDEQARVRNEMAAAATRYQPRSDRARSTAWVLGFVVFTLTGLLLMQDVRQALGLQWWVAFGFTAIFDAIAFALFAWGLGLRWN